MIWSNHERKLFLNYHFIWLLWFLINKKQQQYFREYFFNGCLLSELSDKFKISHSGIQNVLKTIKNQLIKYEKLLSCFDDSIKRQKLYNLINDENLKNKLLSLEYKGKSNEK